MKIQVSTYEFCYYRYDDVFEEITISSEFVKEVSEKMSQILPWSQIYAMTFACQLDDFEEITIMDTSDAQLGRYVNKHNREGNPLRRESEALEETNEDHNTAKQNTESHNPCSVLRSIMKPLKWTRFLHSFNIGRGKRVHSSLSPPTWISEISDTNTVGPGAYPHFSIASALIGGNGLCHRQIDHRHLAHSTNLKSQ